MKIILYLFLFVLVVIYSWVQIYDGDIGHHLKAGEWMLGHGKLLERDIFSYTAYGNFWLNHSWLSEIILYYVYSLAGIKGLVFLRTIILLLSYIFLIKACHHMAPLSPEGRGDGITYDIITAILFIMSVNSASARFMIRPLIFTFLGVAISIYLYISARKDINCLFFMPLLLVLWVNLHAEFMLGVIMMVIFWLYTMGNFLINKIFKKRDVHDSKYYLKANIIFVLCLLSLFINPYGAGLFVHSVSLTSSDLFMTRISEWLPPMHPLFREHGSIKFFYWFLGIGLLSFLLNFKKKDTLFCLFFITFGLMSLAAIRFMPYLTMLGLPIVAENFFHSTTSFQSKFLASHCEKGAKRLTKQSLRRIAVIAVIIWAVFLIERRTHHSEFGFGLAEKVCYPIAGGRFLEQAGVKGNIFNMVDFGGYLIWFHPDRPVFADGRLDVYGENIYNDFLSPSEKTFQKYNINYIFLSYRHPVTRELLYKNERWPLVYWDDTSLIYLKRTKENTDLINRYGYQYINPLTGSYALLENAGPELEAGVWKEIHRAIRTSPDSIRAHVVLGDIYVELKDYRKAIQAYEQAIKLGKRYHTAYMVKIYHNLGNLYHNLREYPEAERYYRRVLKMAGPGETTYNQALEDLGQLAYMEGEKGKAFRLIKKAVKYKKRFGHFFFSDYPITLAKLALIYEDIGKKDKAISAWEEVYKIGGRECRQQAYEHLHELK